MKKNNYNNELFEILNNDLFSFKFISGIAGDRILNKNEREIYKKILDETGNDLYVKLLFYITHQVFKPDKAELLWNEIIKHKNYLSKKLKRNIETTVATLDYLTNIKDEIKKPKLIGEAFIGKIAEMTSIDPLTKLYNRQYLFSKIDEEIKRYNRYNTSFSILMIDIDNFKLINDNYGHQKGDLVLAEISSVFLNALRELDICSRYGGEEFIILLPHTEIRPAEEFGERLRKKIEKHFLNQLKITISIGLSNMPYSNANTRMALIKQADEALYNSKRNGKNKLSII
jgi:two-component system, cell cycle response regulator